MKILYTYKEGLEPVYIHESNKEMKLLIMFKDSENHFVYYSHDPSSQVFLNRLKDVFNPVTLFQISNFERIEDNKQFDYYIDYIQRMYNYDGRHIHDLITGEYNKTNGIWIPK